MVAAPNPGWAREVFGEPDVERLWEAVATAMRLDEAGILFHNTLFDENAACHVAWGQSFPFAGAGGLQKGSEELYDIGLNHSAVHTDVVIGGDGMTSRAPARRAQ